MWSYIQYRRIGRQVEARVQGATNDGGTAEDAYTLSKETSEKSDREDKKSQFTVVTAGEDDPFDPKNWPQLDRSKNIAILCMLIFVQGWAGAAESQANSKASQEFGVSKVAENLSTAMYLFGIGSGSFFAGPLSETLGRNPVYLSATFCYLFFVLGSAMTTTFAGQVVCRYFVGLFCSATLSINGSSVRDQFRSVKRAFVFPVIAWANVASPVIAPIACGWIVEHTKLGWRWTEWITLIISGFAFVTAFLFLPETYLPVLLKWRAAHLRRVTGDERYTSEHEQSGSFMDRIRHALPLPARFFVGEPVVTVLGSYLVLLYVLLFSFLSGFDYIFKETYGLSTSYTGSCFGAIASGATFFTLMAPGFYSWARHRTEHIRGRRLEPEFRLWPGIVAGPLLPVALFWLGWTSNPDISIWSPLAACFLFGAVLIAIYVSSYEYIIDSYGDHAAMGLTSITIIRYIVAGGMVMAARPMYEAMGVKWTMTMLGCIAVLLAPAPFAFWWFGHKLRRKSEYARDPGEKEY